MIRKELYRWLLLIGILFVGISCTDDEIFSSTEIGEGEALVQAEVSFKPFAQGLKGDSRTPGDAIKEIKNLCVLVYDEAGTILRGSYYYEPGQQASESQYKITEEQRADADADNGKKAEDKTQHAEFKLKLPYGVYRIYAVANMGNLAENDTYKNKISKVEDLKSISLGWNANNVSANNQMFGCFTVQGVASATDEKVVINQASPTLHAWIKRAASKVTVAFDGNNLNENVYIYIHSVQIKDIPKTCLLGKDNTPAANSLIAEGETINYRSTTSNDDGLTITKGAPTGGKTNSSEEGGVHHEAADALFFYENMAGTTADKGKWQDADGDKVIDNPDGNTETDPDYKDGVKNGTYIEVKGYYVNKNSGKASQGSITYRFMMGKDVDKDCDAERNYHYKLTLMFNKDANDADWHIVYDVEDPGINVPSPMYISYLHGEKLDIPVVITGGSVTDFKAEIVDNNWEYDGHPYIRSGNSGEDYNYNGFLTFKDTRNLTEVTAANRQSDFENNKSRAFTSSPEQGTNTYTYNVPVYTREVYLGHGFSGNNSYLHKERTAQVRFSAKVNGENISKTITVIQVKRVVNPTGVWRPYNSTKDFHVVLMEAGGERLEPTSFEDHTTGSFYPTISDGPWTASVIQGEDWVQISKDKSSWTNQSIKGSTGSKIDFYYKPAGTIASTQTRCGVIKITYHNNTCVHYVFVSQGDAPVAMGDSRTKWHTKNLEYRGKEVNTPLHEGSMFRYGNTYTAILADNNFRSKYAPFVRTHLKGDSNTGDLWVREGSSLYLDGREWPRENEAGFSLRIMRDGGTVGTNTAFKPGVSNAKVATYTQWNELKDMSRYYGVLYGDDSQETKTQFTDAYQFPFNGTVTSYNSNGYGGNDKGMLGMFVWDNNTVGGGSGNGGHIFLPIGATGHGHRAQYTDWESGDDPLTGVSFTSYSYIGVLKYGTSSILMNEESNIHRPLLWDLFYSWGAIYWCGDWKGNGTTQPDNDNPKSPGTGQNAVDINFHTYDFNTYCELATWRRKTTDTSASEYYTQASDACFIRLVEQ